jgi:hypothetical protein
VADSDRLILCGGATAPRRRKSGGVLELDLNGTHANVNLEISNITSRLASDLPDVVADLIEIATYVYSADQAIRRGGEGVIACGQYWRRNLSFHIAVRAPEFWQSPEVGNSLRDTLSFLSDDDYSFEFSRQESPAPLQRYLTLDDNDSAGHELDEVMLFSGGVDSLAGAVVEGVRDRRRVALVSHRSNSKIHSKQKRLVAELDRLCAHKPFYVPVWANKDKALGREHTQRTRSFLFASLAFAVAHAHKLNRIRFYENGVVSLNLPISEQVVGGRATRTTHPQALNGFADLFSRLLGSSFAVENPFIWLTKGEVFDIIGDNGCADLIGHSISCTHTIDQTKQYTHCGRCSQCVSRRFAALASKHADHDPANIYRVDLLEGPRQAGVDLTLLESFIRTASGFRCLNEYQLIERYGEVSRVLRHVRPLSANDVAERVVRLHRKHAEEVTGVMERALATHSSDILDEKLPPTCAIILAFPGKYRNAPAAPKPAVPLKVDPTASDWLDDKRGPYSNRDDRVFALVGEPNFRVLSNEDIENRFRPKLREIWGRNNGLTANALRSCLNRIRRHHDLPRSHEIRKNAVNE